MLITKGLNCLHLFIWIWIVRSSVWHDRLWQFQQEKKICRSICCFLWRMNLYYFLCLLKDFLYERLSPESFVSHALLTSVQTHKWREGFRWYLRCFNFGGSLRSQVVYDSLFSAHPLVFGLLLWHSGQLTSMPCRWQQQMVFPPQGIAAGCFSHVRC